VGNAIHRINSYPVDKCQQNKAHYPLDSDLFWDKVILSLNNWGLIITIEGPGGKKA